MTRATRLLVFLGAMLTLGLAVFLTAFVRPYYPPFWATVPGTDAGLLTGEQQTRFVLGEECLNHGNPKRWSDQEILSENPIKIAELTTLAGSSVDISVLLVGFEDKSITPKEAWNSVLGSLNDGSKRSRTILVVNSVDERESVDVEDPSSLTYKLWHGCGPWKPYPSTINLGDVSVHECIGSYKEFGVGWISNHAAVIWENPNSYKNPCWQVQQDTPEGQRASSEKYQECMQGATRQSVRELFMYLREHDSVRPNGLVVNAVGTGLGRLQKERWYPEVTSELLDSIRDTRHAANLPHHIFFSVSLPNEANTLTISWPEDRTAIAASVGGLVTDWTLAEHELPKQIEATTLLIPALVAVGILSFSILAGVPKITADSPIGRSIFDTFLKTAGVMSIFVAVVGMPSRRTDFCFFLAFASVFLLVIAFLFFREDLQKKN